MNDGSKYLIDLIHILLPALHLLILCRCTKAFFGQAKNILSSRISWVLYYLFLVYLDVLETVPSQLMILGNILFILLICTISEYGTFKRRCVFSSLICSVWMLLEIIVVTILQFWGFGASQLYTAGSIISKMCMLILVVFINRYVPGQIHYQDISVRYFLTVLIIPISGIFLIHNIFLISNRHREYSSFAIIASILLLFLSFVIFEVYDLMTQEAELREQNSLYEQQLELCNQQAQERENFYLELRRIRHDMKNHLTALQGMVQENDNETASFYIRRLLDDGIIGRSHEVSCTGNIVVDSLVNHKCALARREGIEFEANVFLPMALPFRSDHIAIILGNLLENALEACRSLDHRGRYIRMEASYSKDVLLLTICNPYKGKRIKMLGHKYSTTKHDSIWHGFGLGSVERAVSYYHGQVKVVDQNGIFQVIVVMYKPTEDT